MSTKRLTVYKNGSFSNGQNFLSPNSMEELLADINIRLNIITKKLFAKDGTEITDISHLRHDDELFASSGEDFVIPIRNISSDWITLNVGGKCFTTSRSTLTTKEPSSMLARMFAQNDDGYSLLPSNMDITGAYLIDRSPTYFEPILNYLRSGRLIFDKHVNPEGILQEAKFYGIDSLVPQLENLNVQETDYPLTRRDVVNALIRSPYTAELRFQGVNLSGADLSKLDLRNINFKYANLQGCKLTGCNLSGCCIERADLSNTNIDGAQLFNLKGLCANMEGASMKNCNFKDPLGNSANMEGVNLKFADLEGSDMAGVNLRVATLKNANLRNCDLRKAVLAGADLEKCILSGSDLHEANLRGANLKDASFELMLTPLHMAQAIR